MSRSGLPHASTRIAPRTWAAIIVVGLVGQLAWVLENQYLNLFIYAQISQDPAVIAWTVGVSAVAATLATLIAGAWSDATHNRRSFITCGYLGWGAMTASFGLLTLAPQATAGVVSAGFAAATVVALDAVLTLFGSTANDAAFNAWVTDSTTPQNRGRVDGVLSTFPLIAMLLTFVALDPLTQQGHWALFFGIVGAITAAAGIAAWFLIPASAGQTEENPGQTEESEQPRHVSDELARSGRAPRGSVSRTAMANLVRTLTPRAIARNPVLYITLLMWAGIGIATQVFMPYLLIYMQYSLSVSYTLVLGIVLITASILTVLGGRVMDTVGKDPFFIGSIALYAVGLAGFWLARTQTSVIVVGILAMTGMLCSTAAVSAMVRDATPAGEAGSVQGLRIIAMVLVPMIIGPALGAAVISGAGETYIDLGVVKPVPGPQMFMVALLVLVVTVPAIWVWRRKAMR